MFTQALLFVVALAPTAGPHGLGLKLQTPAEYQRFSNKGMDFGDFAKGLKPLAPAQVMLEYMPAPHPEGQGQVSSCVGWTMGYAVTTGLEAAERTQVPAADRDWYSPNFVYSLRQNAENEPLMTFEDAVEILQQHGCAPWTEMPYREASANDQPSLTQRMAAYPYRIAQFAALPQLVRSEQLKPILAAGLPVAVAVVVTPALQEFQGGSVYREFNPTQAQGGHAVCLVGYDDQRQAFRMLNSWGVGWGDQGYAWVSYDLFDQPQSAEQAFCRGGVVVFGAPTYYVRTEANPAPGGPPGEFVWSVWIEGSPDAMARLKGVEYTLPIDYEPNIVRRFCADDPNARLQSHELQPASSSQSQMLHVRFLMDTPLAGPGSRPVAIGLNVPGHQPGTVARRDQPRFTARRGRFATGALIETDDQYAKAAGKGLDFAKFVKGIKSLPESAELKYMPQPHPQGQGQAPSCVGWALAYAAKSALEGGESGRVPVSENDLFSPSYIFSQRPPLGDGGMYMVDGIELLRNFGCCPWSLMPYAEENVNTPPDEAQRQAAFPYQIGQYMFIPRPIRSDAIKLLIARDIPVVIAAFVGNAFMDLKGDTVYDTFDLNDITGGHAMCIVGYDDARGAFKLINSWGTGWGDSGYGWVSYKLFDEAEGDITFCKTAIGLIDAPNVRFVAKGRPGQADWEVRLEGPEESIGKIHHIQYIMPAGFEPRLAWIEVSAESPGVLTADKFTSVPSDAAGEIWATMYPYDESLRPGPRPIALTTADATGVARRPGSRPGALSAPQPDGPRPDPGRRLTDIYGRMRAGQQPAPAPGPAAAPPRLPATSRPTPAGNTADDENQATVPNLVGLSVAAASATANRAGLKTRLEGAAGAGVLQKKIIRQDPPAGRKVAKGSTVTVAVE